MHLLISLRFSSQRRTHHLPVLSTAKLGLLLKWRAGNIHFHPFQHFPPNITIERPCQRRQRLPQSHRFVDSFYKLSAFRAFLWRYLSSHGSAEEFQLGVQL